MSLPQMESSNPKPSEHASPFRMKESLQSDHERRLTEESNPHSHSKVVPSIAAFDLSAMVDNNLANMIVEEVS